MELNQLRYFQTVARTESITRAAAELYITQSALSRVILRLENELGTPLFNRQSGRIVLNDKGKLFLNHVNIALKELDEGVSEVSGNGSSRVFSMYNYLATNIFELITSRCQANFPSLEFENHNYEVKEDDDPIRKFAPDVVVTPNSEMKSYSVFKQYTERWCVIFNDKYEFADPESGDELVLAQLANEPIAFFGSNYDRAFLDELFESHGLAPKIHSVENTAESGNLINRCKAIGLVPVDNYRHIVDSIAQMPIRAKFLEDVSIERTIYLMKKNRFPTNDEERSAFEFVVKCLDDDHEQIGKFIEERF